MMTLSVALIEKYSYSQCNSLPNPVDELPTALAGSPDNLGYIGLGQYKTLLLAHRECSELDFDSLRHHISNHFPRLGIKSVWSLPDRQVLSSQSHL